MRAKVRYMTPVTSALDWLHKLQQHNSKICCRPLAFFIVPSLVCARLVSPVVQMWVASGTAFAAKGWFADACLTV